MGLDAQVFCDCVERGRLQTPHPFPERLYISEEGRPEIRVDDLPEAYSAIEEAHDNWLLGHPCEHKECVLVAHYLGNIALVAALRGAVKKMLTDDNDFLVLRHKVIYSGIHAGDQLNREQVEQLAVELRDLQGRNWSRLNRQEAEYLRHFINQLDELIAASRQGDKPIVF